MDKKNTDNTNLEDVKKPNKPAGSAGGELQVNTGDYASSQTTITESGVVNSGAAEEAINGDANSVYATIVKPDNKFVGGLNKVFKIRERGSSIKAEVIGGFINFLMMVYVVALIPNILTRGSVGDMWNAIYLGTLLSIIITGFAMAFGANLPLVAAPGLGLTAYFANLLFNGTYTYSQALTISLIAGILFVFLTLIGFRKKIVAALPSILKSAIPAGIGLFILSIGLNSSNSGILDFLSGNVGHEVIISAAVAVVGLLVILALHHYKVKGSVLFGILGATVLYIIIQFCIGNNPFEVFVNANFLPPFGSLLSETFANFDFVGTFVGDGTNIFGCVMQAIMIVFSYVLVDLFDTVGTLYGATKNTSLMKDNGDIVNFNRALWVDGTSTITSSILGVPGCTTYVESAAGVKSGARTGLATLVTTLLFIIAMFLGPVFALIPACAIAPALIFVGYQMLDSIMDINFKNFNDGVVAITTMILMPLTGNIAYGIGVGLILYCFLKIISKKAKEVSILTYILAALFIILFITQNISI